MRRILVVKLADLGDLLTATPALRALRCTWPDARISALVTPHAAPLLDGNDAVDRIVTFPKAIFDDPRGLLRPARGARAMLAALDLAVRLRRGRYDAVVLLHHLVTRWGAAKYQALVRAVGAPVVAGLDNGRGAFLTHRAADRGFGARHEVEYNLDVVGAIGATSPEPRMELHLSEDELARATRAWAGMGLGRQTVVLHPGSGRFSLARRWDPARFAAVGDALAADGLRIAVLAGPGEEPVARAVQQAMTSPSVLLRDLSIRDTAATLCLARLFIGNDSGVMHVAAAVQTPIVAVFGLSNHRAWGPFPRSSHEVVRLDLPCSPCLYRGLSLGTPEGCPPRACLTGLSADPVIAAARRVLHRSGAPLGTRAGQETVEA